MTWMERERRLEAEMIAQRMVLRGMLMTMILKPDKADRADVIMAYARELTAQGDFGAGARQASNADIQAALETVLAGLEMQTGPLAGP